MKGSIVKRGNKFSIVVDIGRDPLGKRQQRWFSGYNTRKEAEKDLPKILVKIQSGELISKNKITLGDFSKEWLVEKIKKDNLSPVTIAGYENIINNHIVPTIGTFKLQDIKAYNLQKYFDLKAETLATKTLDNHMKLLTSIFLRALDMDIIEKNPLTKVKIGRIKSEEVKIFTIEECKILIDKVQDNLLLKMPVILALFLGLRRGECLGLRWSDIDFNNKTVTISQNLQYVNQVFYFKEPKTKKSKRTLAIPDAIIPLLKEHQKWQKEMTLRSYGHWRNERNLVCTKKLSGGPVAPNTISDAFRKFLVKNDLPLVTFHGLRHTNASLMLAGGVSAKAASTRLGHNNISITLDLYTHLMERVDIEAAEKINNLLVK